MKTKSALIVAALLLTTSIYFLSCTKTHPDVASQPALAIQQFTNLAKQFRTSELSKSMQLLQIRQGKTSINTLEPDWNDAALTTLSSGRSVLIVGATDHTLSGSLSAFRKFVFYQENGVVTDGEIVEFYGDGEFIKTNSTVLISSIGENKIDNFSGYIMEYNLGYIEKKGSLYVNGELNEKAAVKISSALQAKGSSNSANNRTTNSVEIKPNLYYAGNNCLVTYLDTEYYDAYGEMYDETYVLINIICENNDSGGGETPPEPVRYGGYMAYGGPNKIGNIADYLKCFDNIPGSGYKYSVTLAVDQPVPGDRDPWGFDMNSHGFTDVGHTFLIFTETKPDGSAITRNIGFYPTLSTLPGTQGMQTSPGELDNNANHGFDIGLQIDLTSSSFTQLLGYVSSNASVTYNLSNNNCTTFALNALASIGSPISATKGSWPNGYGYNPGDLGEDIRGMSLGSGMSRVSGSDHPNTGICY